MTKAEATRRDEAKKTLRTLLKPGDTVKTIARHVARSGMSRSISIVISGKDGAHEITYLAARAMGDKIDPKNGGIKVSGCGMDMGFSLVYNLGWTLWPSGHPCTGKDTGPRRCPSGEHSNGDRVYDRKKTHKDGGYALRQVWL